MGKFIYLANIIAADVDFYNIEGNRGDSYLPFIGFMMFVVGAVVALLLLRTVSKDHSPVAASPAKNLATSHCT